MSDNDQIRGSTSTRRTSGLSDVVGSEPMLFRSPDGECVTGHMGRADQPRPRLHHRVYSARVRLTTEMPWGGGESSGYGLDSAAPGNSTCTK